ncbi:hypothetical protein [Chelativorans sp. AA-79]|uniref:hypothetical protein n=1 Tax=Chelativorans sp. AA-79 TaxID=3028735 RepID=UPI0023F8DFC7|nr:hypothetical protein [Chelativorans sp. AA-79]WEX08251.1 hypothetical protein PVE73_19540 [Chelativorans sp. AA-79]
MAAIISLDPRVRDAWLSSWIGQDMFCATAIQELHAMLPGRHFMVVLTIARAGQPYSVVFRAWKTPPSAVPLGTPPGFQTRRLAAIAHLGKHAVEQDPLPDHLFISKRSGDPCSFVEALDHARGMSRFWPCPVIYVFDGTAYSRA